jgi:hypothetical protein
MIAKAALKDWPFTALWLNRPVVDDGLVDEGDSSSIALFTGLLAVMA